MGWSKQGGGADGGGEGLYKEWRKNHRPPVIWERAQEGEAAGRINGSEARSTKKKAGWRYQERLQSRLPGLEQHSLKWMRAWINQELGA